MQRTRKQKLRQLFIWIFWIIIIQIILANISAAIYAYKFTHFYTNPPPYQPTKNVFAKTWKLFVGPRIYKLPADTTTLPGYEKIKLQTNNQLPIEGWYGSSDSVKACVVFLHGITNSKDILLPEAEQFKKSGYNVLLIDFRAHGNSGGNKSSFGVKETDEVQKAFEFAKAKGNKNILLYGSSLGSVVALKAVAEGKVHPQAIITDMPFGSLQDHLKARARTLGFPSEPFAFLVTLWIGIENGYNGFNHDTYDYAEKVKCPVLIQWGDKDIYVIEEEINNIFQKLGSKEKRLIVYPGINHESYLRYDPVNWQKNVRSFIASLPQ
jgi:alpha-beta hydrolase superfamily lysophospholipase